MINFKLLSGENTITGGILLPATTAHGHRMHELKEYFSTSINCPSPRVIFDDHGDLILLDLKLTARGFAGTVVRNGKKWGCNFNRVVNKPGRWGLTVWSEELQQQVAV